MSFISQFSPSLPVFQNCTKTKRHAKAHTRPSEKPATPRLVFVIFTPVKLCINSKKYLMEVSGMACWAKYYEAWIKMEMSEPLFILQCLKKFFSKNKHLSLGLYCTYRGNREKTSMYDSIWVRQNSISFQTSQLLQVLKSQVKWLSVKI